MTTLFALDIRTLRHYNWNVQRLKSYKGTPEELPGDDERIADARRRANAFLARMLMYHLGG